MVKNFRLRQVPSCMAFNISQCRFFNKISTTRTKIPCIQTLAVMDFLNETQILFYMLTIQNSGLRTGRFKLQTTRAMNLMRMYDIRIQFIVIIYGFNLRGSVLPQV